MNKLVFATATRTRFGMERTVVIDVNGAKEMLSSSDDSNFSSARSSNIIFKHGFKKPGRLEEKLHVYKTCKNPKAEGRSSAKRDRRRDFRRNHAMHMSAIME